MFVENLLSDLTDLLWPRHCAACDTRLVGDTNRHLVSFCEICKTSLMPAVSPKCPRCALPFDSAGPDHLCSECLQRPPPFRSIKAVYRYGGAAADVVLRLKYGRLTRLGKSMGRAMARIVRKSTHFDVVIPIPLHRKKLIARGFNQSALLGREISRSLGIPMDTSTMVRARSTTSQAGLSRQERLTNIRGAFVVKNRAHVEKKHVLLVDDVVTTATTVREASKVLVQNGAHSVEVVAFARAG